MPRAPQPGREIRRRSRNGCWNCKARKVKCGEEKPRCSNCERLDEDCDYKIRLSWGGRPLKKKQMLNGEEQTEDDSMFLPGAGQFSIRDSFPQPQTFVSQANTNGASVSRKPPVVRPGKKSGGMASYQNVFSLAEPSGLGPTTPTSASPEEIPQGSSQSSSSPPHRAGSLSYYPWSEQDQSQTSSPTVVGSPTSASTYNQAPATPVFKQESFESEAAYSMDPSNRHRLPPHFPPISTSYVPHIPSPIFSNVNLQSPLSPSYSQHQSHGLISPPQQQNSQKAFHPPPEQITTSPKRVRTGSPPMLPTPHPVYFHENYSNGLMLSGPTHIPTIAAAYNSFINGPFDQASIASTAQQYNLDLPAITNVNLDPHQRRLSVASILSPVSQDEGALYPYHRLAESVDKHQDYPGQTVIYATADGGSNLNDDNDDDVIDIPIYTRPPSDGFAEAYRWRMTAASTYYQKPVSIPRGLDPLPPMLVENERNMMYFKHFLSFTARLLVPHDCSENPFKKVLPQMAVGTDKLMNLLLAYSASHRARLLNMPEPTDRINEFLNETIKDLNASLRDDTEKKSDSTLATLIMLCSYDIISPSKLISWRQHLNAARNIILSRGETDGIHCRDNVSYFLVRWFAYLDVLGSLSGRDNDQPLFSGKYWINDNADESEDSAVDCVLGFTSKCVSILAKIGELARRSDQEKKRYCEEQMAAGVVLGPEGQQGMMKNWVPPKDIWKQATQLEKELEQARIQMEQGAGGQFSCEMGINGRSNHKHSHHHPHSTHNFIAGNETDDLDNQELMATNDAFHLAASVHLYRRVMNLPSRHGKVQRAVAAIIGAMHKVRHNGDAENCLLFPLFTAGCEATQEVHRAYTLKRMQAVEKIGMTQVTAARRLMERVWNEGVPWETLSDGEFIG